MPKGVSFSNSYLPVNIQNEESFARNDLAWVIGSERALNIPWVSASQVNLDHTAKSHNLKVDPNDLSYPICVGMDGQRRPFLIIKVDYTARDLNAKESKLVQIALVIHEKYSPNRWTDPNKTMCYIYTTKNKGSDGEIYDISTLLGTYGLPGMVDHRIVRDLLDAKKIDLYFHGSMVRSSS